MWEERGLIFRGSVVFGLFHELDRATNSDSTGHAKIVTQNDTNYFHVRLQRSNLSIYWDAKQNLLACGGCSARFQRKRILL
jgi:hypothetical protein